jgi:large repetitive protein
MEQGRKTWRREAAQAASRPIAVLTLALAVAAALTGESAGRPPGAPELGPSQAAGPAPAAPDELLIRFGARTDAATRAEARRDANAQLEDRLPLAGLELVRVERGTSTAEAMQRLEQEPGVLYAEPNHYRSAERLPNDPYFGQLWGLHNLGQSVTGGAGTPDADVDGPEAWDLITGNSAVTVAIVDSGVSRTHADLAPNMWANPGETGGGRQANRVDDDRNGYVDDAAGWDWVESDADPADVHGHGTHVAGTVAARGDNGTGVTGVAWHAGLMALRVLDEKGSGTVADAIEAYAYAGGEGARVLNASLGGPSFSRAEYDAIRAIPGVLFVAAAGNDGRNNDSVPQYPCNYQLPNIVCVAATGQRDALAGFSNYGAGTVDLAAPGTSILSTWPGGYAYSSGTSMATPHVAGAAALAFAHWPGATSQSVKGALLAGVDLLPSLAGRTVTGGRLNVYTTLAGRPPAGVTPAPSAPPAPPPAAPDRTPPQIVVQVTRRQRLRTVLRRGVRVIVGCSEGCSVRAQALIGHRAARRGGLIESTLTLAGGDSARLSASGRRVLRIRLRRSAKRRLIRARRPLLRLRITASDAAGNTRATTRRIRVKRSR